MKIKPLNYTVVFQKEPEGGFTAFVPILPGCVSYGKDLPEAKKMIKEAIKLYLESLEAHKEEIPVEHDVFYSTLDIDSSKLTLSHA